MINNVSIVKLLIILFISTFIAAVFTIVKLPTWLFYFRPDWLALVTVYWVLAMPERLGILYGFTLGLILDLLLFKLFGLNALGFAFLAFIVSYYHQQLRIFGLWQQALLVAILIAVMKLLVGWISGLSSEFEFAWFYWYSLVGDIVVWPFIYILSRDVRRSLGHRTGERN